MTGMQFCVCVCVSSPQRAQEKHDTVKERRTGTNNNSRTKNWRAYAKICFDLSTANILFEEINICAGARAFFSCPGTLYEYNKLTYNTRVFYFYFFPRIYFIPCVHALCVCVSHSVNVTATTVFFPVARRANEETGRRLFNKSWIFWQCQKIANFAKLTHSRLVVPSCEQNEQQREKKTQHII